ncbi:MAG: response regulator [Bdellovibrionales bacterium]|nr:response regulator [Bdellovibrionales bacterium]
MVSSPQFSLSNPPVRILVVDDEESILWSLSQNLTMANDSYCVGTAESAEEALTMIDKTGVDVLITDYKLPKMDGLRLIESVNQNSPDTRSILMTAYGSPEVMGKANARGSFAYVEKPFTVDQLLHYITESISADGRACVDAEMHNIDIGQLLCLYSAQQASANLEIKAQNAVGKLVFENGVLRYAEFDGIRGPEALVIALAASERVEQKPAGQDFNISLLPIEQQLVIDRSSIDKLLKAHTPLEQLKIIIDAQREADGVDADRSYDLTQILRATVSGQPAEAPKKRVVIGRDPEPKQDEKKKDFKEFSEEELVLKPEDPTSSANSESLDGLSLRQLLLQSGRVAGNEVEISDRELLKKRAGAYVNRGVRHFKDRDLDKARVCWEKALEIDPDCGAARKNLKILESLKDPKTC